MGKKGKEKVSEREENTKGREKEWECGEGNDYLCIVQDISVVWLRC